MIWVEGSIDVGCKDHEAVTMRRPSFPMLKVFRAVLQRLDNVELTKLRVRLVALNEHPLAVAEIDRVLACKRDPAGHLGP